VERDKRKEGGSGVCDRMKILQIGCGGIGSFLISEIMECVEQGQIDAYADIRIADKDIVEIEQIKYQNFKTNEIGMNKALALGKRFEVKAIAGRVEKESQLKGYDIIVLCVDNERTRELVISYCHKNNKEFLDLRATGKKIFAMPKTTLENNIKFVDSRDLNEYGCQDKADLEKGLIQKGNKIVALIGVQMLLNLLRGHSNRTISVTI
jgi:saccharopine dehydrogenase-like NADP-dependent oxidoreductase